MISTYQTRVTVFRGKDRAEGEAALAAYAELYSRVQRKLFADIAAGNSANSLKSVYLKRYGIPARMFNALRVSLEGKVASVRETMVLRNCGTVFRYGSPGPSVRFLMPLRGAAGTRPIRRSGGLVNLKLRLAGLEADIDGGRVRLCFGSKRLWRKQHDLKANGYSSHEEWLADWEDARNGEFFVLGSRDETGGCELCVASIAEDGSLTLRFGCRTAWVISMASTW